MMGEMRGGRYAARLRTCCAALAYLVGAGVVVAAPRLAAQTHVLIISGLGGEAQYSRLFADLSRKLVLALHERAGVPEREIVWLGEDSVSTAGQYGGISTKAHVLRVVQGLATRVRAGDQVVFILVGHGAGEGPDSRISIPGPDLSATDFAAILARFPAQRIAFVDLTSASGDMIATLSAPGRVIITATKTAFERNESHFARFFVDAFAKDVADADKDGRVSLLEAFKYAAAETRRLYETEGKILTEHAQLDDDGDKQGSADPSGRAGDGVLARRFFLDAAKYSAQLAGNDPRLAALYTERFALEEQIDALKGRKATMAADAYDDELEKLLVALARKAREIRTVEGRT
ncbi:MAG TPA: hypothetical protein VHE78_11440 [Gemmatimonadaceae bacterium]|nr:hypothetical protein [Gemmatimonadaceae bacterium]